jgi:hypothetical protein
MIAAYLLICWSVSRLVSGTASSVSTWWWA